MPAFKGVLLCFIFGFYQDIHIDSNNIYKYKDKVQYIVFH